MIPARVLSYLRRVSLPQFLIALSPLESALMDKHRVLPCFDRNRPPV